MRGEKTLDSITGIEWCRTASGCELRLTFGGADEARRRKRYLVFKPNEADLATRTYATDCATADAVMEDLFAVCARRSRTRRALAFRVVKVNQAGKKQDRTFRLTVDSLLNLDGQTIRTEVAFSGIESVRCAGTGQLYLKYKSEDFEKPILCNDAEQLRDVLLWAMRANSADEAHEESTTVSEGRRETQLGLLPAILE